MQLSPQPADQCDSGGSIALNRTARRSGAAPATGNSCRVECLGCRVLRFQGLCCSVLVYQRAEF